MTVSPDLFEEIVRLRRVGEPDCCLCKIAQLMSAALYLDLRDIEYLQPSAWANMTS